MPRRRDVPIAKPSRLRVTGASAFGLTGCNHRQQVRVLLSLFRARKADGLDPSGKLIIEARMFAVGLKPP